MQYCRKTLVEGVVPFMCVNRRCCSSASWTLLDGFDLVHVRAPNTATELAEEPSLQFAEINKRILCGPPDEDRQFVHVKLVFDVLDGAVQIQGSGKRLHHVQCSLLFLSLNAECSKIFVRCLPQNLAGHRKGWLELRNFLHDANILAAITFHNNNVINEDAEGRKKGDGLLFELDHCVTSRSDDHVGWSSGNCD